MRINSFCSTLTYSRKQTLKKYVTILLFNRQSDKVDPSKLSVIIG